MLDRIGFPWGFGLNDIIIGVIFAAAVGWYFWKRGIGHKQIIYAMKVEDMIFRRVNLPSELQITYGGQPIDVLTKVTLFFWNAGNQSIELKDLNTGDPLQVVWPNSFRVFSSNVLFQTRDTNLLEVEDKQDDPSWKSFIQFAYLNVNDGAVIEFVGTRDEKAPLKSHTRFGVVKGEIIGAGVPPIYQDYDYSVRRLHTPLLVVTLGISTWYFVTMLLYWHYYFFEGPWLELIGAVILGLAVFVCILIAFSTAIEWCRGYRVPIMLGLMKRGKPTWRERLRIYFEPKPPGG
jgi:hypothetical protein